MDPGTLMGGMALAGLAIKEAFAFARSSRNGRNGSTSIETAVLIRPIPALLQELRDYTKQMAEASGRRDERLGKMHAKVVETARRVEKIERDLSELAS